MDGSATDDIPLPPIAAMVREESPPTAGILDLIAAWITRRMRSRLSLILALSTVQGLLWTWAQFGTARHWIAPAHPLTLLGASLYRPDNDLPIYLCGALACVLADAAFAALLARRPEDASGAHIELLVCLLVALLPLFAPNRTHALLAAFALGLAFVTWRLRRRAGSVDPAPDLVAGGPALAMRAGFARDCVLPAAILALFVFVPWPHLLLWRTFDTDQFHHLDFYVMAPALAHAHGLRLGTDFYAQYGVGWPLLFEALGRVTGARGYTAFIWLEVAAGCVYFLGLYAFLRSWLRHAEWATVGLLLALALALFTDTGGAPKWIWPSSTVLRYAFDVALFAVVSTHARSGNARLGPLAGAVLALQAVFSTDVGLYLSFAFCVYLVCSLRRAEPGWSTRSVLRFALGAAGGFMLIAGACFTWANQGQVPDGAFWRGLTESIFVYGGGIGNLPIARAISGNGATALLLLAMLATYVRSTGVALCACWSSRVSARQAVRATIAVYGMGTLLIFVGRSHEQNLMHVTIPWCLLLAESAASAATAPHRPPRLRWTFTLAMGLIIFIAVQAATIRYPNLVDGVAGLLDVATNNRPRWTDAAGDQLPAEPAVHLAEFRFASDAIRKVSGGGRRSVAVIAFNDTAYLLEAGVAPYFRYSPVLANLLFKEQVDGITRRLAEAPPDWIFLSTIDHASVGDAQLTDSTSVIRHAIEPAYDLLGGAGQFAVYRRKIARP
jgi:hypothetical protein